MTTGSHGLDPMFFAVDHFKKRNFEKCVNICTDLLTKNPYDKVRKELNYSCLKNQDPMKQEAGPLSKLRIGTWFYFKYFQPVTHHRRCLFILTSTQYLYRAPYLLSISRQYGL